jgi:hypothetical protein
VLVLYWLLALAFTVATAVDWTINGITIGRFAPAAFSILFVAVFFSFLRLIRRDNQHRSGKNDRI